MPKKVRLSRDQRQALLEDLFTEVRMHQNAQDAFDDAACALLGINRSDGRALDIIERRGPITAGELAREAGLSTAAITALLDRMERIGYVRRVRDTADRRRVLVELTDEARRRASSIWGPIAEQAPASLAGYSDEDLAVIRDFLRGGREFLTRHLARIAPDRVADRADAPGGGG